MKPTNKPMKRLSLYLFLILFTFQTPSQADDIRDFQIEGMSIGDSLLKMYSDAQIKGWSKTDYESKKFSRFNMKDITLETYDDIQFHYLTADKNYTIKSIVAGLYFEDLSECFKKQFDVFGDIKKILSDTKTDFNQKIHRADKKEQSKIYRMSFNLNSGAMIEVTCIDWSDEIFDTKGWRDHLRVGVSDEKFLQWIKEEAY